MTPRVVLSFLFIEKNIHTSPNVIRAMWMFNSSVCFCLVVRIGIGIVKHKVVWMELCNLGP